jgi:heme/copper-type cytochrome/quinol oxidase subunit 2
VRGFRSRSPGTALGPLLGALGVWGSTSSQTILQQVSPLIWVMIAIAAGGAIITYAFLVYAVWRYRDPSTRRRNYG